MSDALDTLTAESTADDIDAVVEQLAEEAEAEERAETEEKSDAQVTSEHADNEDTAEDDTPLAHSDGEKTGKSKPDESAEDWREEAAAEASAYGFSEEDIADFETREELDRALKLFERQLQKERDTLAADDDQEEEKAKTPAEGDYEVRLDKDIYDEDIVDEFTRLRDHYESRLASLEQRFQAEEAFAAEEKFDRTVDDLGFAQVFGKTGEETKAELARRKELFERVKVEQEVLERLGRKDHDYSAMVSRVARAAFPDEYDKKLLKNHTRKISRQSNARQGGGATRPTDPPEDPRDAADRLYRELAGN